jgi:ABC-type sulfate transport system substrate-binding protein
MVHVLQEKIVHYRVHKSPPVVPSTEIVREFPVCIYSKYVSVASSYMHVGFPDSSIFFYDQMFLCISRLC